MTNRPEDSEVIISDKPPHKFVSVQGDINLYSVSHLRKEIMKVIDDGCNSLVMDMKDVRFMDSSGIALMANIQKIIKSSGGTFFVLHLNNEIKNILKLAALERYFKIVENESELN